MVLIEGPDFGEKIKFVWLLSSFLIAQNSYQVVSLLQSAHYFLDPKTSITIVMDFYFNRSRLHYPVHIFSASSVLILLSDCVK